MSKEQIEERNELADLLKDIGYDWDSYICECQENEEQPQLSYEDFHADAILDAGYRKQEWISVEERLPEEQGRFLIVDKEGQMNTAFYTPRFGWFSHFRIKNITHWMPLPMPPKGESNDSM